MPAINIPTSFNIDLHFETPGFFRRMVALIIDMVMQYVYLTLAFKVAGDFFRQSKFGEEDSINTMAIFLLMLSPVFLYHIVCEILMNGQSFGKKVMGIRVVSVNGGRPGLSQFLIRWLLRVSDTWIVIILFTILTLTVGGGNIETWMIFIFGFGFLITDVILVALSKKSQRIGDLLAHTIIIKTNQKAAIEETVFQEVTSDYKPKFPTVMRISDRDLNYINRILQQSRGSGASSEARNAANTIKTYLNITSGLDDYEFLETLMKDYNYLSAR